MHHWPGGHGKAPCQDSGRGGLADWVLLILLYKIGKSTWWNIWKGFCTLQLRSVPAEEWCCDFGIFRISGEWVACLMLLRDFIRGLVLTWEAEMRSGRTVSFAGWSHAPGNPRIELCVALQKQQRTVMQMARRSFHVICQDRARMRIHNLGLWQCGGFLK